MESVQKEAKKRIRGGWRVCFRKGKKRRELMYLYRERE
jgi:hypothetical protein